MGQKSMNLVIEKNSNRLLAVMFLIFIPVLGYNFFWFVSIFTTNEIHLNRGVLRLFIVICVIGVYLLLKKVHFRNDYKYSIFFGLRLIFLFYLLNIGCQRIVSPVSDALTSHLLVTKAISLGWNPFAGADLNYQFNNDNEWLFEGNVPNLSTNLSTSRAQLGVSFQAIQSFYNLLFATQTSIVLTNLLFVSLGVFTTLLFWNLGKSRIYLCYFFLCSPIILQQFLTGYVDLAAFCIYYSVILLSIFLFENKLEHQKIKAIFFTLVFFAATIKLNLLLLISPILALSVICYFFEKDKIRKNQFKIRVFNSQVLNTFAKVFCSLVFFSPAINLVYSAYVFNPLQNFSKGTLASSWAGSSIDFSQMSGTGRLWSMLAGRTDLNPAVIRLDGLFSWPITSEIEYAGVPDARIGGLGPLWGDAIVVSAMGVILILISMYLCFGSNSMNKSKANQHRRVIRYQISVYLIMLIGCVILPLSFNARYHPQYHLLVFIPLMIIERVRNSKVIENSLQQKLKILQWSILALVLINSAVVLHSEEESRAERSEQVTNLIAARAEFLKLDSTESVRYYLDGKLGLLLPLTGDFSGDSYYRNVVSNCPTKKLFVITEENIGLCILP